MRADPTPRRGLSVSELAYLAALVEERAHVEGFAEETQAHQVEVLRQREALAEKREAAEANAARNRNAPATKQRKAPHARRQQKLPSRKAQTKILEELTRKWAEIAGKSTRQFELPPWLDFRIRSECDRVVRDATGKASMRVLCMMPGRVRAIVMRVARREYGGWRSTQGARLIACAWATWRLSRDVQRGGRGNMWAGGKVVEGYARRVWCLLVRGPRGEVLSVSTLWGTHTGSLHRLGPMALLAREGAWTRVQPPADVARFVGPSGWAVGQMWFGRRNCGRHMTPEDEVEYGADLRELLGLLGLLGPPG